MESIAGFDGDNFGSIIKLLLIDARDVQYIAPAIQGTVQSSIIVEDSSQFREIIFSSESAGYSETFSESKHGVFYKQDLSFFVPKDRPEVVAWLRAYSQVPCIALITNAHGKRKIIGSSDYPLLLAKADLSIKEKVVGLVGRTFSYRGQCPTPAPFYEPPHYLLTNSGSIIFQNNQTPICL